MLAWINGRARKTPTWVVYGFGGLLFAWLVWRVLTGGYGPDPVKVMERQLGLWGLQFVIATLCITPLRWAGLNLIKFRRGLGLLAFFFISLHFITWIVLDQALRWGLIVDELWKRPFILIGFGAFLAMVPLAATSFNAAIRRIGPKSWARLHKLVYGVALAGVTHYLLLVKVISTKQLLYLAAVLALLGLRYLHARQKRAQPARV